MSVSTTINGNVRQWKRYSAFKSVDLDWCREVPSHWTIAALKRFARFQSGDGITALEIEPEGEFPVYGGNGLRGYSSNFTHEGDFVLLGRQGALCGNVNYASGRFWASEHAVVVTPSKSVSLRWYGELLRAMNVGRHSMSAAQPGLSVQYVVNLLAPVPPLDEQHRIFAFINNETAKIDALIAKKERLIELLLEKRTALIGHAVTKGLDPTVPVKDSGVEWLGKVPAHWTPKKLKYLFRFAKRLNHPDLTVLSVYRDFGVIAKTTRDDNHNKTPEDLTTYQLVNVGDLVINKMKAWQGSLGISSLHGITSPDYVVYKSTNDECLPYLHHRLRIPGMAATYHCISNGIRPDQWRLEPDKFEQLWLYLPPVDEQQRICEQIDKQIAAIDVLRVRIQDGVDKLREYRTALISAAVTGKIDVREEAFP